MAKIQIFGNILSYATPSASGDLVPKWYVDAMTENPGQTTMTIMSGTSIAPTQTGQVFYKEVTANTAFTLNASGLSATNNEVCEFYLVINSSGKTVTLPSGWVWAGGSAPTIAYGTSIIHVFTTNAKSTWRAELLGVFSEIANSIVFTIQVPANTNIYLAYGEPFESPITATWGDGVTTEVTTGDLEHTYATAGTYQVKLKSSNGKMPLLYFVTITDYLISVDHADVEWYGDSVVVGTNLLNVGGLFGGCANLTSVPVTLFARNNNIGSFSDCFYGCSSLENIPNGLFGNNTSCIDFASCFNGCSSLVELPSGLFSGFSSVTTFVNCFNGCSSLQSIPADTFEDCSAATSFVNCFQNCSSLLSIPSALFEDCVVATDFSHCFQGCSSLTTVPTGLFDGNTAATNFANCFMGCSDLVSVPSGLFDENTAANNFGSCFYNCSSLTTVPAGLFDSVTSANFGVCFSGCSALVPATASPYVPQVWEKDTNITPSTCFYNTPASIRQYVPAEWGGNILGYDSATTYSNGDWVYYESGGVPRVYTYINDTSGSGHAPSDSSYWAYGYLVPATVYVTFRREKSGYGLNHNTVLTFNGTAFTKAGGFVPTWTQGSFNSASWSDRWQQQDTLMMSDWALSGGILTVTLSAVGPSVYPTSGLSGGDVLTFGGFVESEDSNYYYATSTTYSKN